MPRHDREDPHSLEEQLAWLDAIKENEETPTAVTVSAVETSSASPYPKDPWLAVPSGPDPSPPLFRAAVDSIYGPAGSVAPPAPTSNVGTAGTTETNATNTANTANVTNAAKVDEDQADTATWRGPGPADPPAAERPGPFTLPSTGMGQDNDAFLAPLKPLPRPEDTGAYRLPADPRPAEPTAAGPEGDTATSPDLKPPPAPDTTRKADPAESDVRPFPTESDVRPFPTESDVRPFPAFDLGASATSPSLPSVSTEEQTVTLSLDSLPGRAAGGAVVAGDDTDGFSLTVEPVPDVRPTPAFGGAGETAGADPQAGTSPSLPLPGGSAPTGGSAAQPFPGTAPPRPPAPTTHLDTGGDSRTEVVLPASPRTDPEFPVVLMDDRKAGEGHAVTTAPAAAPTAPSEAASAGASTGFPMVSAPTAVPVPPPVPGPPASAAASGAPSAPAGPSAPTVSDAPPAPAFAAPTFAAPTFAAPAGAAASTDPVGPTGAARAAEAATSARHSSSSVAPPPFTAGQTPPARTSPAEGRDSGGSPEPTRAPHERPTSGSGNPADRASAVKNPDNSAEPYRPRRRQTPPPSGPLAPQIRSASGPRPTVDSLDPESLLRGRRNAPTGGWRRLVYKASAGWIKPGESPEVRRRRELVSRARTLVAAGHHRVAVLSLKGGVGKTTTTVGLGATLAQVRGDRVIAVDANPDRGTLSDKVELETAATVRDLLNERGQIKRYVDVRAFTSQTPSRLEILASDRDPSVSEAFSAADYQSVAQVLENFYSICITDCGTGLLHSAMSGVLGLADQLVLVSSPSVDGARAASATLDWLEAHHYGHLVRAASVVLCNVRPRSKSTVDLDRLEAHFAARCRSVVRVPYDAHLEEGAEIDLERLQPGTRDAYLRLAASVGDGFAGVTADRPS
ncbi:MinD-like ATPase involved in chromosome partitioning or flagellar assembly [Sinosporangium album]|uniref:MinD-like ATPase involved in chromosome partitioning or flagellar assembly n=1 Tax=Sinosporangium album TaxID=504805 RepID=A0A1G8FV45_9ACTN|nr:MinD/ParA family protein [Sinosporangium album]SDH86008.1 MinD-like ATPase involved in chromosome partitioning or flagellar assembly [Sinosporangium album]